VAPPHRSQAALRSAVLDAARLVTPRIRDLPAPARSIRPARPSTSARPPGSKAKRGLALASAAGS